MSSQKLTKPNHRSVSMRAVLLLVAGILCALMSLPRMAVAEECHDRYKSMLDSAFETNDFSALNQLLNKDSITAECSPAWIDSIRLKATQLVANAAEQRLLDGDIDGAERLLLGNDEATFSLAAYWSVNAVLGDIAREDEQWTQAARQYGEAYELASADSGLIESDPTRAQDIQMQLFRLASESLRLGEDLTVAISRSGSGSGTLSSRGFKPVAIPLPVTFEFDSAKLSSDGIEQAGLIAGYLARQKLESVTLTGHTDWKGCAPYNQQLSEKRAIELAAAVSVAFENNTGKQLQIDTQGAGESCPPVLSNASSYTPEQRAELARRVEINLGGDTAAVPDSMCDKTALVEDGQDC